MVDEKQQSSIEAAAELLHEVPEFKNSIITTADSVRDHMVELNNYLEREAFKYYTLGKPDITDEMYDFLYNRMVLLEKIFPAFKINGGITSKVGGDVLPFLQKADHAIPLLSLKKAFTVDEVVDFFMDAGPNEEIIANGKLDGLALELIYNDGVFTQAITRGDGVTGEDVTEIVRTIRNVPKILTNPPKGILEVRGEVVLPKEAFHKLNMKLEAEGEPQYSNSRNAVSGILRVLDPKVAMDKPLAFFAYGIGRWEEGDTSKRSLSSALGYLTHLGFSHKRFHVFSPMMDDDAPETRRKSIQSWIEDIVKRFTDLRPNYDIDIDGIVFAYNKFGKREELGSTSTYPRHSIAYKFPASTGISTLVKVEWQVGRTGVLTPVAHITPVTVHGVVISRVTLHNAAEIERLGIIIGDKIEVSRQGDVIPKITTIMKQLRTDECEPIVFPDECPVCSSQTVMNEEGNFLFCTGNTVCGGRLITGIEHFASREAMDIRGLGLGMIRLFVEKGYLSNLADIFTLHEFRDELYKLEGLGKASVDKLLNAIDSAKFAQLHRFLYAIGINGVGLGTAKRLARHFNYSFDDIRGASPSELESIEDIGPLTAELIYLYFQDHNNLDMIHRMVQLGLEFTGEPDTVNTRVSNLFRDNIWAITGSFEFADRKTWEKILEERGAKVVSNVTKNTTHLLAGTGTENGSKIKSAKANGIEVITESELIEDITHSIEASRGTAEAVIEKMRQPCLGQTWVVSGSFELQSKEEWEKDLKKAGAKVEGIVTENTTMVLRGNNAKNAKAVKLALQYKIPMVSEYAAAKKFINTDAHSVQFMQMDHHEYMASLIEDEKERQKFIDDIKTWYDK